MVKDTWYKRLGWFLFYSAITLVIFFLIDLIVQRIVFKYENSNAVVYFIDDNGNKTNDNIKVHVINDPAKIRLKIFSSVDRFTVTVSIDGMELNKVFENTNIIEFELPALAGEYIITCNVHTNPIFGKEQDTLLTRKVIVNKIKTEAFL